MTIKKLVLIGAGPANLYALTAFKALPRADTDVHFVTPYDTVVSPRMVCGLVAGHYSVGDCSIHLPTLLGQSAIKSHFSVCTGLDTRTQQVHLQHGAPLHYDVLSLDTSPVMDRELMDTRMAGAKEHALFVQPLAQFAKLWPQVLAHAQQHALNISVIGASPVGVEMALALQHQLPHCRVTLLAQSEKPEANTNPALPQKIISILKSRRITVLHDSCKALQAQSMLLNSGASLSCDMALIASGEHPPAWLSHCDLALDAQGHALVNSFAQATSYPQVFSMSGFGMGRDQYGWSCIGS